MDEWKHQPKHLQTDTSNVINHIVNKYLRDEAARIAQWMDPDEDIYGLLVKFDAVVGKIEPEETRLAKVYTANQRQ